MSKIEQAIVDHIGDKTLTNIAANSWSAALGYQGLSKTEAALLDLVQTIQNIVTEQVDWDGLAKRYIERVSNREV